MKVDFDALYRSHYRRVFGLCLRLLNRPAHAEDAAQEVFVRAYRSIDRYDERQPFEHWVLGIASNHCVDLIRRQARERRLFDESSFDVAALDGPDNLAALIDDEQGARVRAAIAALPEKYRLPIVLAYYRESSYDDIATVLGITRNHVGVLLLRAKQALRQALAESRDEEPRA